MATYKDIQRLTGLSLATISKHYNGGNVLPANRDAILRAAEELEFRPNEMARGLRSGRSATVGVLVPSLDNGFVLGIVAGVERLLYAQGVGVLVCSSSSGERPGDAIDALRARKVDGIVAVPTRDDVEGLQSALRAGMPVVTVDHTYPGLAADHVQLDNRAAGELAAHHLLTHGHTKIGLIGGDDHIPSLGERRDGFLDALSARGISFDESLHRIAEISVEAGRRAALALLSRSDAPTAVFSTNYDLSVGALIAVNESGLIVPRDVSLVGFDLEETARVSQPRTTSIVQPTDLIAEGAAGLMIARLRGSRTGPAQNAVVPSDLVAGGSVARIR